MTNFILQAEHNAKFHGSICTHHVDSYFDWKITCLFYVAIHYIKALAAMKGMPIGNTHGEIEKNISPLKPLPIMPISKKAWDNYKILYRYSRSCRYDGFRNEASFEKAKEIDHNHSLQCLQNLKNYLKSQGVPLN